MYNDEFEYSEDERKIVEAWVCKNAIVVYEEEHPHTTKGNVYDTTAFFADCKLGEWYSDIYFHMASGPKHMSFEGQIFHNDTYYAYDDNERN